ncbi:Pectinesterase [Handroanthus impetiginosus]|uniref:pectinesterase n=1 Tax=Handroanthus impetiginosus TaxID=429701 RepID=A0A2G9HBC1_9LAMI|nr:Pectinesterase [Handroanthus impetiginosus]
MGTRIIMVAQDCSADYTTVQEAIDAVPLSNTCRTVIRIAPGFYRQPVYVPKTKNLITLAGIRPEDTVLTWNNTATKIDHHQGARVIGTGTFGSGSTIVEGEDFIAENITFENSAPETQYTYLGRPWGPFGRVVLAYTYMDACIKQDGWNNWGKPENERTACFYEYRCFGPGSCPSKRVEWARELIEEEAEQFLAHGFVDPDPQRPWLAQVMAARIPYSAM